MHLASFYLIAVWFFKSNKFTNAKVKVECGYKQCPQSRDGALNVHLIPHSHMDAGWVKTFDEYYYGTKTSISTANVQLIYHSVLSELLHDKRRKFTFSETAYFWRWWKEQRPATRSTFRTLVQEGRVEFAGGGWVQNDEATADYLQIIDQYTWGLRKLNDTLGPCGKPKAAWQIDTYGHSREQASLLAQMGYDGLFLGRVDHKERETMIEEDRLEFMWRGSDVLGKMSDIMSHVLFNLYNAPEGFCFDFLCNDEPIIDDPDTNVYNADKRINDLITQIERQAKYYDHDNIMLTMGGDFTYQSAANWFMNMDKLINHVTTHPANISDINIFYSTPSCYLKSIYLYGRRDKAIFTERGDHFPYGSDSATYWTGFYSTRPALKYLVRRAHVFLQVVKQLTVISRTSDSYELHLLRHAVSLVLHHDGITGTSQQHVANDFVRILIDAMDSSTKKASHLLGYLTPTWGATRRSKNSQQFIVCHQLNVSECRFTENQESMLLLVYNPLSVKTYFHVRLPAVALHYSIRDYNDEEVEYQLVALPAAVTNTPGRNSAALQELCFEAESIPPLGFTSYYIAPVRDQLEENDFAKKTSQGRIDVDPELVPSISNEFIKVTVDKSTGLLESIQHVDGLRIDVTQNFYYYSQTQQNLQSGAYSFRPDRPRPTAITDRVTYNTIRGSLVKEIRQRFSDWVTQSVRLHRGEEYVELEWIIGPVPIGTDLGKEIVSIFSTNITNNGEFFTDSNSRQMMKRSCLNQTNSQKQKKPVAACYYPVTSRICIHSMNSSAEMCVMTDRAQGGTSYNEGEIELMVHRRLLTDDGFGLEESLNEEAFGSGLVVKGKHRILFGNFRQEVDDQTFSEKVSAATRRWQYEPWMFFASGEKINRRKWQNVRNKRFAALKLHGLPRHVHVLTLEPWKSGSVLLRLENTLDTPVRDRYKSDGTNHPDDFNATPTHVTVDLRKLFLSLDIRAARETTLAANQWLDDARQMDWSTRYVYNGADDGLLPEDAEETQDKNYKQADNRESDHSSYEEEPKRGISQPRQKPSEKGRFKVKTPHQEEFRRRRRSLNITENINENVINYTVVNDSQTNDTARVTETANVTKNDYKNVTFSKRFIEELRTSTTNRIPNRSDNTRKKPLRQQKWRERDAIESMEVTSSEERTPKQRTSPKSPVSKRLKKMKSDVPVTDDSDDGITRSIYDMYYRNKPRNPYKPDSSSEKLVPRKKSRRLKNYREEMKSARKSHVSSKSRRREKGATYFADGSLEMEKRYESRNAVNGSRVKQRRDSPEEDFYESGESESSEKESKRRRKRMLPRVRAREVTSSEDDGPPETEYIITLRPTQIRTFIIWFHQDKKKY